MLSIDFIKKNKKRQGKSCRLLQSEVNHYENLLLNFYARISIRLLFHAGHVLDGKMFTVNIISTPFKIALTTYLKATRYFIKSPPSLW